MTDTLLIGEKLLCLYASILQNPKLLIFYDNFEIASYNIHNISIFEINNNIVDAKVMNYILTYEFGQVFKLSPTQCMESLVTAFVNTINLINTSKYEKHYVNYNNLINKIQQHILNTNNDSYLDIEISEDIRNKRNYIQQIQLYNKNGTRKNKLIPLNI